MAKPLIACNTRVIFTRISNSAWLCEMAKFSITPIALKWHFFSYVSGANAYLDYANLFMKQLGFNPAQIGLTNLFGLPNLLIPLCLYLGEKFRARKTVVVVVTAGQSMLCILPLLSLIVPALQPRCASETAMDSFEATPQAVVRNASSAFQLF